MKKRTWLIWLLAISLAWCLSGTALAAEEEVFCEIATVVDVLLDPPVYFAQDGEDPYWDTDVDNYGEVLEGNTGVIYKELERRFAAHVKGTEEIPLEAIRFTSGVMDAWVIRDVLTGRFSSTAAREAWVAENKAAAEIALIAFLYDHPEYFWIRQHYAVSWQQVQNTTSIVIYYVAQEGFDDLKEQQEAVDEIVAQLTEAVKGLSDSEKVAWWDNWLAVSNAYHGKAADVKDYITTDATPWCAMGALLKGYEPVCEGYAKALQLLCHEAEIPCVQVSGVANGGGHMWTAIKLEGDWYFCDPTWDDPGEDAASADYSVRTHLLTRQPSTHATTYYPELGLPKLAGKAYGRPMEEAFGWHADSDSTPLGYELGNDTMLIALYDENGKFLAIGTCDSIRWSSYQYIYLAPVFDDALLEQTGQIVRFNTYDWHPASEALPIL